MLSNSAGELVKNDGLTSRSHQRIYLRAWWCESDVSP